MKILHITAAYKPAFVYGGPTRSVSALCEALVEAGHTLLVLTTTANGKNELNIDTNEIIIVNGVCVRYHKRWTGDHSHFSPPLLLRVLKECRKYDVVHIHSWWNLVSVLSTLLCLLRGVVPVLSVRGTLSEYSFSRGKSAGKRVLHWMIGKRLLHRMRLHVTSRKESAECAYILGHSANFVIPNVLDLPNEQFEHGHLPLSPLRLTFLGRIHPVKNLEFLFDVLAESGMPPFKLTVMGDGDRTYIEQLKQRTSKLSITWLGSVTGKAKFKLLSEAHVLVLMSETENYGNVVVEALSQGTAVVVSEHVGVKDFVTEHKLGWVVPLDRSQCLETMKEISDDRESLLRIRKDAPGIVREHLGRKTLMRGYVAMYRSMLTINDIQKKSHNQIAGI